jgi:xanthine dehydrogenase molybdopterin binding subunit/xanthine dehydrogenase small subunit
MHDPLSLVVNGVRVSVPPETDLNHTTLSQFLRGRGSTDVKEGCAEGDCGACSVVVADPGDAGHRWRAIVSCVTPVGQMLGREVRTAAGLVDDRGALHPVQAAMVRCGGSQCGYCTPGFVTSMFEGYERADLRRDDCAAVADQLCGNLCRCTGYRSIRDAMTEALAVRDGVVADAELVTLGTRRAPPLPPAVLPPAAAVDVAHAAGRFLRPTSVDGLLALKARHGEQAVLVGGATELGVLVRKRAARFGLLVDTTAIPALQQLQRVDVDDEMATLLSLSSARRAQGAWAVGGAATLARLEEAWLDDEVMAPAVRMLRVFASRQVKNRATLAGNLVTASPIGDMAPILLSLGAVIELASTRGSRRVALSTFFTGYRKTVLAADEVVARVVVVRPAPGARFATYKVSKRRELDISIVAASFYVEHDDDGIVTASSLGFGGVAATPAQITGLGLGRSLVHGRDDVAAALAGRFSPLSDVRASQDYRRGLLSSLWTRFVDGVVDEAHDGDLSWRAVDDAAWPDDDVTRALRHESAAGHVTGAARYVDDIAERRAVSGGAALHVWPVQAKEARGTLVALDTGAAAAMPGVRAVLTATSVPGDNDIGAIRKDEPLFVPVGGEVQYAGQMVACVVAATTEQARAAAAAVTITVTPLAPVLGCRAALAAQSFHKRLDGHDEPHTMRKGDVDAGLRAAPHRLSFELDIGGQEHFYLETHAAFAEPGDDGDVTVWSSTQHPSEVQAVVSHVLHLPRNRVVVVSPRMGGGFGGKETQGNGPAALVALAATMLGQPVRLQWDRDVDMTLTGKRHPFLARGEVGFFDDGRVHALRAELYADGGFALDLSESIHDRALFHIDNAYDVPHVELSGRVCKTNTTSHTAFRGFGGPQGMLVIEDVMTRIAQHLGLCADDVRARNFYAAPGARAPGVTPYGQVVEDFRLAAMWPRLLQDAGVAARRAEVARWNASSRHVKRGLAVTPVKFGISFTASFLNQAGALVHLYRDGSVQVNHGGTEMGQGLYTKILGITCRELGIPPSLVRVTQTRTDKVPNTSATAASSGADLNGAAVVRALAELKSRLSPVAAILLEKKLGRPVASGDVHFLEGQVRAGSHQDQSKGVAFEALCEAAYLRQVSLSATGYYRTPDIGYDKKSGHGKPFHYFAYGVCAAEVELDGTTGMKRVRRVDVLHDVGDSLNPHVDRGQIEGALVQGIGWLTGEHLVWDDAGRLQSHSASTYQIPSFSDAPAELRVQVWGRDAGGAAQPGVVHGSKAVGEPPFMLAFAVREALKDALAAFAGGSRVVVDVPSPLTHERLFGAVAALGRRSAASEP